MPTRRLYLLRHAKSSWDDRSLPDRERPLSKRGRNACKRIARHLEEAGIKPGAVVVSPAARTQETLERIRPGLPEGTPAWTERRLYQADATELLELLRELPPELRSALLIGHNPAVGELAVGLAGDGDAAGLAGMRRKYPTGGLATICFAVQWHELRFGVAELESFVRPKKLPDA
jgi:phosphohistidine phosphatase